MDWLNVLREYPLAVVFTISGVLFLLLALFSKISGQRRIIAISLAAIFIILGDYLHPFPPIPPAAIQEKGEWTATTQREVEKLKNSKILFNPPLRMIQGKTERVEARISYKDIKDALTQGLRGKGLPIEEPIKVSPIMRVRLDTKENEFQIKQYGDEEQVIIGKPFSQWEWDILPIKSGTDTLHLKCTAVIYIPDVGVKTLEFAVIDKDIEVDLDLWFATKKFVVDNWQWLSSALFIPFVIWICRLLLKKKPDRGYGTGTSKPEDWIT